MRAHQDTDEELPYIFCALGHKCRGLGFSVPLKWLRGMLYCRLEGLGFQVLQIKVLGTFLQSQMDKKTDNEM